MNRFTKVLVYVLFALLFGTLFRWAYDCQYLWLLGTITVLIYIIGLCQGMIQSDKWHGEQIRENYIKQIDKNGSN